MFYSIQAPLLIYGETEDKEHLLNFWIDTQISSNHESPNVGLEGLFFNVSIGKKVGPSTIISAKLISNVWMNEPHVDGTEHAHFVQPTHGPHGHESRY